MQEAEQAYAAHIITSKELHQAQLQMMQSKRAIRALNDELSKATAVAAAATELVDRKRKAAAAAKDDFNSTARMTRRRRRGEEAPLNAQIPRVPRCLPRLLQAHRGPARLLRGSRPVQADWESQQRRPR